MILRVDVYKVQLVNVGVHQHVLPLFVEIRQLLVPKLEILVVLLVLAI